MAKTKICATDVALSNVVKHVQEQQQYNYNGIPLLEVSAEFRQDEQDIFLVFHVFNMADYWKMVSHLSRNVLPAIIGWGYSYEIRARQP